MPSIQRSKLFDLSAFSAFKPLGTELQKHDVKPARTQDLDHPWEALPTEIFERIIDFLHSDKNALVSCSLVCTAWYPTTRYHLLTLLPLVPVAQGYNCCKVNTAVALSALLIYLVLEFK